MPYFYISFATDDGFLGATVVDGITALHALKNATLAGLNPGGQAAMIEVPIEAETNPDMQSMIGRLVTREELMAQGASRLGDLDEGLQDKFADNCEFVCEPHNRKLQ